MESQSITTVSFASAHAKLNPATHFSSLEKTFAFPDLPESFPTQANVHGRLREGNKRRQLGEKIDAELPQTASLSLGFEQAEDVIDLDWALDVTDDAAGSVIHELDTDLGDTTTGAGTAENTSHLDELNRLLGGIHLGGWARRQREG